MKKLYICLALITANSIAAGNYSPLNFTLKPGKNNNYVITMVNTDEKTVNIQDLELKKLGDTTKDCTKIKLSKTLSNKESYDVKVSKDIITSCSGKFNTIKQDSIAKPDKSAKLCMAIEYKYDFNDPNDRNFAFVPLVCK